MYVEIWSDMRFNINTVYMNVHSTCKYIYSYFR